MIAREHAPAPVDAAGVSAGLAPNRDGAEAAGAAVIGLAPNREGAAGAAPGTE